MIIGEHYRLHEADTLFATGGDKIFIRKLKTTGANAWDVPSKPPAPRL